MKKKPEFKLDRTKAAKWLAQSWPALEQSGLRADDLLTLFLRDIEQLTYHQIGHVYRVTGMRAWQVYQRIRRRLRHPARSRLVLMDYRAA